MSSCKGFGRIDCVVTVLCVAFLIPTIGAVNLQRAIHAKAVLCRSNLQKWYVSASMFTADNDDSFWPGWVGSSGESFWWLEALQPYYVDADKIRCCPTATQPRYNPNYTLGPGYDKQPFMAWGHDDWLDPHDVFDQAPWGSYAANGCIEDKPDVWPLQTPKFWRHLLTVESPGRVPFMTDAQWIDMWPEPGDRPPGRDSVFWNDTSDPDHNGGHFVRVIQNRHGNGWQNCAFLDGSVRQVGLKELWTFKWHREYDTAGRWTLAGGVTRADWQIDAPWMTDFQDY